MIEFLWSSKTPIYKVDVHFSNEQYISTSQVYNIFKDNHYTNVGN